MQLEGDSFYRTQNWSTNSGKPPWDPLTFTSNSVNLHRKIILKLLWDPGGKVRPRRGWTDEEGTMFELDSSPNPNQPTKKPNLGTYLPRYLSRYLLVTIFYNFHVLFTNTNVWVKMWDFWIFIGCLELLQTQHRVLKWELDTMRIIDKRGGRNWHYVVGIFAVLKLAFL